MTGGPYNSETVIAVLVALARVESVIGSPARERQIRDLYGDLIADYSAGEAAACEFVGGVAYYANVLHARTYGAEDARGNVAVTDAQKYYCCAATCPGYPYRASERPHPCPPADTEDKAN